jgi:hypothetical protein
VLRVWLAVAALFAVLCAPASADVFDDNPAAASLGPGSMYVFVRAADGTILERHLAAGAWTEWAAIPGLDAQSGPAAAAFMGTIQLFARGPGLGSLWHNSLQDGRWSGWVEVPGGPVASAPALVQRRGREILDVAVRGTDNSIRHRWLTPSQNPPWSGWDELGGNLTSAPAIVSWRTDQLDVWSRGTEGNIYGRYAYQAPWGDWYGVPGGAQALGAPTVVSRDTNQFDLFIRWIDNTVHLRHWDSGAGWGAWTRVDYQPVDSSPAVASDQPSRMTIFARIGDGIQTRTWSALPTPNWSPWTSLGTPALPAAPAPVPAVTPPPTLVTLQTLAPVLSYNYKAFKRQTRLSSLRVRAVPAGATVKVTCPRGCSAKSFTKRGAKGSVSLARFVKRPLKAGTTLTVVVSKPGAIASVKTLKIRSRKPPLVTTRCQPPSAAKPQAC